MQSKMIKMGICFKLFLFFINAKQNDHIGCLTVFNSSLLHQSSINATKIDQMGTCFSTLLFFINAKQKWATKLGICCKISAQTKEQKKKKNPSPSFLPYLRGRKRIVTETFSLGGLPCWCSPARCCCEVGVAGVPRGLTALRAIPAETETEEELEEAEDVGAGVERSLWGGGVAAVEEDGGGTGMLLLLLLGIGNLPVEKVEVLDNAEIPEDEEVDEEERNGRDAPLTPKFRLWFSDAPVAGLLKRNGEELGRVLDADDAILPATARLLLSCSKCQEEDHHALPLCQCSKCLLPLATIDEEKKTNCVSSCSGSNRKHLGIPTKGSSTEGWSSSSSSWILGAPMEEEEADRIIKEQQSKADCAAIGWHWWRRRRQPSWDCNQRPEERFTKCEGAPQRICRCSIFALFFFFLLLPSFLSINNNKEMRSCFSSFLQPRLWWHYIHEPPPPAQARRRLIAAALLVVVVCQSVFFFLLSFLHRGDLSTTSLLCSSSSSSSRLHFPQGRKAHHDASFTVSTTTTTTSRGVCCWFFGWVSTTRDMLLSFLSLQHNKRENFLTQQASYCMM